MTVCMAGQQACAGTCVNVQVDAANCGACGQACAGNQLCAAGHCGPKCSGDETVCGGACVNTMKDASNCGACGVTCLGGLLCAKAICAGPGP